MLLDDAPWIGQGMGNYKWNESQIEIIRAGIDAGMNFIDTCESYDDGYSEEIVGKAIEGIRDQVIIGTKFSVDHNGFNDVIAAAEGSLKRLKTDYIDLYQMHWPDPEVPFDVTLAALLKLKSDGKVRYIGMCNIPMRILQYNEQYLDSVQIEYNLFDRTAEEEILPICQKHDILLTAYSPLDQGKIADGKTRTVVHELSKKYKRTPAQISLNWLIVHENVMPIPKSTKMEHVVSNAAAVDFDLEADDIERINQCKTKVVYVLPSDISVSMQGEQNRETYQTLDDALRNKLGFIPSPKALSKTTLRNKDIKPVRLIKGTSNKYDLVEGRIRYWAWVIAHGDTENIPAYIREDWP